MGEPVTSLRNLPQHPLRLALALAALLLATAADAEANSAAAAADSASCLVRIIHAKHEGKAFDPQLETLRSQLTAGPLSVWQSFKLLDQPKLDVQVQVPPKATEFKVPGMHQGKLELLGKTEDGKGPRLRLRLQILDGQAKLVNTTFLLKNEGNLLIGGIEHEGGKLILGITCKLNP
jgi:hypothetical protein